MSRINIPALLWFAAFVTLGITAFTVAHMADDEIAEFKAKAISHGAAEWKVNPATGETSFVWKESK